MRWITRIAISGLAGILAVVGAAIPGIGPSADVAAADDSHPTASEHSITLITGDVVRLSTLPNGRQTATIDSPNGRTGPVRITRIHGDVYVLPADAMPYLHSGVLDKELFNVTALVQMGYGDESAESIPLIITYDHGLRARRTVQSAPGTTRTAALQSIDGAAVSASKDHAGGFWRTLQAALPAADKAEPQVAAGIEKVWLDRKVRVQLDESVPQIGAPQAWEAGYNGKGVDVAVLDTGIDATHPDLADQIEKARNFSGPDPENVTDHIGHGTHVASIIAGTGDASGGRYTGVAPGADLMIGKVVNDRGVGLSSWIINGMEWAAHSGAEVVNMSLGTRFPTDGTDPQAQAVNELTEETGTLFVVAAGNAGPGAQTVSSPASADAALAVGAVTKSDELASFSSRGPRVGDYAIKPEITAPGVDITAARAAGTNPPAPVGQYYMTASGTSMASPHVAGAAAILAQEHPDWQANRLKAALVSTAATQPDNTVYQQGAGRVDVARAYAQQVYVSTGHLDLGFQPWPHADADPVVRTVTYTNASDDAVTLDLAMTLADNDGNPPASGMFGLSTRSVSLDPGQSKEVTITLDPAVGDPGLYGGYLVATGDGELRLTTAVGTYLQPEMHTITVHGLDRQGRPVPSGSGVQLLNLDTGQYTEAGFVDGTASVRIPVGTYSLMAYLVTLDAAENYSVAAGLAGDPQLKVTEDIEITLDAREAKPIEINTPKDSEPWHVTVGYYRNAGHGGLSSSYSFRQATDRFYAVPTQTVTKGTFEFYTKWRRFAPDLRMRTAGDDPLPLDVDYVRDSAKLDGTMVLPLVDAGTGTPKDFEDVDAQGAIALVRRSGDRDFTEQAAAAAEDGAKAVVVYNDRPGLLTGYVTDAAPIPVIVTSRDQGRALLERLEAGTVRLRVAAIAVSPYLYDLVLPEDGRIPSDLTYDIGPSNVARIDNVFHGQQPGQRGIEARFWYRPWQAISWADPEPIDLLWTRTEWVSANDTTWYQKIDPHGPYSGQEMAEPPTRYTPGDELTQHWFGQVVRPSVPDSEQYAATRAGDTLDLHIFSFVDASNTHFGSGFAETRARLYQDGELIADKANAVGQFDVGAEPSTYRLELDVRRKDPWWKLSTRTHTEWTFHSQRPSGEQRSALPLMVLDYNLDLDMLNRARDTRAFHFDVHADHQVGVNGPRIAGMKVWVSYDGGQTWSKARHVRAIGDGGYRVLVKHPKTHGGGFVSLRVRAWDTAGNAVDQTVIHAYALK